MLMMALLASVVVSAGVSFLLHAGMVHTRYHFKVHAEALPGALARFGAMLSAPLIAHDRCGPGMQAAVFCTT
jgi:hypothetical protein